MAALSQDEFVAQCHARWHELETLLGTGRALHALGGASIARAASLYRSLCTDLMRSRGAGYTPDLIGYLDALAARAHSALYSAAPVRFPAFARLLAVECPRAVRDNIGYFALAFTLFYAPLLVGLFSVLQRPEVAFEVLPRSALEGMVSAYSSGFDDGRATGVDAGMAGFYVFNNVGIAFRCFATGIFFGAGSMFFLVYNGLVIGMVTGYVMHAGHGENILTFMCGHGPFELTAIVIAGAAGLKMGYALVETGGLTRIGSLRTQAPDIARLVVVAAMMLVVAAAVEAFWSPSSLPPPVKWTASAVFTLLVIAYLALAGRERRLA